MPEEKSLPAALVPTHAIRPGKRLCSLEFFNPSPGIAGIGTAGIT